MVLVAGAVAFALVLGLLVGHGMAPTRTETHTVVMHTAPEVVHSTGPGPAKLVDGIPVGYAHSRDGAVAAAMNLQLALGRATFDPKLRATWLRRAGDPSSKVLTSGLTRGWSYLDSQPIALAAHRPGVSTLVRGAVLGYRILAYTPETATVSLWAVSVFGNNVGIPVQDGWTTSSTSLRWIGGDWKVTAIDNSSGPAPAPGPSQPASAGELIGTASQYQEPTYGG